MKLIQIFAVAAALAVTAAAQSTSTNNQNAGSASPAKPAVKASSGQSAQKSGTGNQTSPVTLTVPKGSQTTAGGKNSTSASSTSAKGTAKNGTSQTAVPKTPVLVAKPAQQPATSSKKPATAKTAKTADKTVAAKPKTPKKTVVATKKEQARVVPQKVADNKKKPGSGEDTIKSGPAGRRDPFLSVIRTAPSGPTGPSCSVGKKCLYIPELVVKGIAKDTEGQMLAVVVSNTHRAYFLRENDQVFNGSVEKITGDSVVFREYATDHLGRETAHEVVKRIPKT